LGARTQVLDRDPRPHQRRPARQGGRRDRHPPRAQRIGLRAGRDAPDPEEVRERSAATSNPRAPRKLAPTAGVRRDGVGAAVTTLERLVLDGSTYRVEEALADDQTFRPLLRSQVSACRCGRSGYCPNSLAFAPTRSRDLHVLSGGVSCFVGVMRVERGHRERSVRGHVAHDVKSACRPQAGSRRSCAGDRGCAQRLSFDARIACE